MMKTLIIIAAVFLIGCSGWTPKQKTLLTVNGVLMTMDMLQTNNIYQREDEGYYEINPVIDYGVGRFGRGFVPVYFVTSFGLRYLLADTFPRYRTLFLTSTGLVSAGLVVHNNSIGLKFDF